MLDCLNSRLGHGETSSDRKALKGCTTPEHHQNGGGSKKQSIKQFRSVFVSMRVQLRSLLDPNLL